MWHPSVFRTHVISTLERHQCLMINVLISALSAAWSHWGVIRRLVKSTRVQLAKFRARFHLRIRRTTKSRYVPRCLGVPPGDAEFFNFLSPPRSPDARISRVSRYWTHFRVPECARSRTDKSCSHLDDLWNFRASGRRTRAAISIRTAGQFSRNLATRVPFLLYPRRRENWFHNSTARHHIANTFIDKMAV